MYQQSIFSTKGNTFDSFKLNAPQKSTFLKLVFNAIHREALTDKDKPFRIAQLGWQTNVATAIRCCGDRHTITWRPPYDNVATATRHQFLHGEIYLQTSSQRQTARPFNHRVAIFIAIKS